MSELTICNYCRLKRMQKRGFRIVKKPSLLGEGYNIYRIPKGQKLDRKEHWIGWMMEITDHCVC